MSMTRIRKILIYFIVILIGLYMYGRQIQDEQRLQGPVVKINDITESTLTRSLLLTTNWYKNNIDPVTKIFKYQYDPIKAQYIDDDNQVRQLATGWAITNVEMHLNNKVPEAFITPFLDYYIQRMKYKDNYAYLELSALDGSLAYNAFMIQILLNSQHPNKETLIEKLANGILHAQREDGSYETNFISPNKNSGVNYYPGEAMLALANLYKYTNNKAYMESIQKAFPYYRTYWRAHKNTAFIPWQTEAYVALYNYNNKAEIADFVIEMNNWLIAKQYTIGDQYKLGGFGPREPNSSSSVYLEGINDAYVMLLKINDNPQLIAKYKKSIILGTRYVLQTQYNEKNTYFKNQNIMLGGFRGGITRYELRIDMTQHGSMAVLKALQNHIFD